MPEAMPGGANTPPHVRDTARFVASGTATVVSYPLDVTTPEGQEGGQQVLTSQTEIESQQLIFKFKFVTKEITSHRKSVFKM